MAVAAATQNEDNKCALVDSGLASRLVAGLKTCNQAPEVLQRPLEKSWQGYKGIYTSKCE